MLYFILYLQFKFLAGSDCAKSQHFEFSNIVFGLSMVMVSLVSLIQSKRFLTTWITVTCPVWCPITASLAIVAVQFQILLAHFLNIDRIKYLKFEPSTTFHCEHFVLSFMRNHQKIRSQYNIYELPFEASETCFLHCTLPTQWLPSGSVPSIGNLSDLIDTCSDA
jgi:hypothetical protein